MSAFEIIADATDEAAWHEARRTLVTASDVAAVCGLNPYCSALEVWARKTGRIEDDRAATSEAVRWGTLLEPVILGEFARRTGRRVERGGVLLRSTRYPWLAATLDGWTWSTEDEARRPVEAKAVGLRQAGAWEDGIAPHYEPQVATQAIVTGTPDAWAAALVGGQRLVVHHAAVTDEWREFVVERTREFYDRYLLADVPPPPDGSESTGDALAALHPQHTADRAVALPDEARGWAERLALIAATTKALGGEEAGLKHQIQALIGDAERGVLPGGGGWTWRAQSRAAQVHTCSCGTTHECVKGSSFRVLRAIKEGR